ncbi:MAG: HD-GYP domain-containing protein [Gammaproteobacteria bacterium]
MANASVVDLLPHPQRLLLSEVIASFSYSLDMAEGVKPGHSLRCCWLGSQIGKLLSLNTEEQQDLYYVLLLKDCGGTSISSKLSVLFANDEKLIKHGLKLLDTNKFWESCRFILSNTSINFGRLARIVRILPLFLNGRYYLNELIRTRSERGSDIVIQLGFNDNVADGIHSLNEHWDGNGYADGVKDHVIPISSQIALLSEVFEVTQQHSGFEKALDEIQNRSSSWFNPDLVKIAIDFLQREQTRNTWQSFRVESILKEHVYALDPGNSNVTIDDDRLDDIATAFAQIVDAKSPYTNGHSTRVALYSDAIANELGLSVERRRWLYRGALLHDLGNMGITNLILDKQSHLTKSELQDVRLHTRNTFELLHHMQSFKELAKVASSHHEQLDGKGYPKGMSESRISLETRIISVANTFDTLMTGKPLLTALPLANVLLIMEKQCDTILDRDCFKALKKRIPDFFG